MTETNMPNANERGPRVAIVARYNIEEQFKLAAEYHDMIVSLTQRAEVMHISLRGTPEFPERKLMRIEELPFSVNRSSATDILIKSLAWYACIPKIAALLRRFQPEIAFIPEALPMSAWAIRKLSGVKVAMAYGDRHLHNRLGDHWWSRPFLRMAEKIERFELCRLDGMFSRTRAAEQRIHESGVEHERIQIVYDVPEPGAFYPRDETTLRKHCGFEPDDVVLLYHGVMHRGKGLDDLIQWTAELIRENPRIGLIMVGSGPEIEALKEQCKALGIEKRVHFTGWLRTTKEVGSYCSAADICIAMRKGDASNDIVIPGALVHSMACAKVVIAPRLRGMAEVIRHGENGFMFTANDGEDFKRLIRHLIEIRPQWNQIGEVAYQDTEANYTVAVASRKYADAILHFTTNPRKPRAT